MKLSARNMLQGKVVDVRKDDVAAQIRIDIGGGNVITSAITSDSVNRLGLGNGKAVTVVVKAGDAIPAVYSRSTGKPGIARDKDRLALVAAKARGVSPG